MAAIPDFLEFGIRGSIAGRRRRCQCLNELKANASCASCHQPWRPQDSESRKPEGLVAPSPTSAAVCLNRLLEPFFQEGSRSWGRSARRSKCFVSGAEFLRLFAGGKRPRAVKTFPLVIGFEMSTMAVCICGAAIGARMESGMPIGPWSSRIVRRGGRGSALPPILASWMSKGGWESNTWRNQSPEHTPACSRKRPALHGSRWTCPACVWSAAVPSAVAGWD